jgi:hypothetical protein
VADCMFCGQPFGPERERSKEHAAPQWCRDLLPNRGPAQHTRVVKTPDGTTHEDRGNRDPFSTTVNDVCKPCNTGWMHELEEASRGLLGHFIQGDSRNMRLFRQVLAATWGVKTAMVWESVSPEQRAITPDDLRRLYATQRPGARQQVWVGHFAGAEPHSFRHTAGQAIADGTGLPENAKGYLAALSIGQLAMVVYGHTMDIPARFAFPPQLQTCLLQIWPPVQEVVRWPPPVALNEDGLDAIVSALGPFDEPSEM